jgi:hypothetical protein
MRSHIPRSLLALSIALVGLTQAPAAAQCNGVPDGLSNGLPCTQAALIAQNGKATTTALAVCWQDCQPVALGFYDAEWGLPAPVKKPMWPGAACGWDTVRFRIYTGNQNLWSGKLRMVYSRTWMEANPVAQYQVWRFLVNGDLSPIVPNTCATPPCAASFGNLVHFSGYIDYAFNCANNTWEHAWMLAHTCDRIEHAPGFPRAGFFHPDWEYTFVGPGAGFNVGVAPTLENGGSSFEALRSWDLTVMPPRCRFEEPMQQFSINTQQTSCLCGTGPGQWHEALMFGAGQWGSSFAPIPGSQTFLSMAVGSWTNPLVYPGQTEVRWNTSYVSYIDGCVGPPKAEYFYGATTTTSNFPFQVQGGGFTPLPQQFVDMANQKRIPPNVNMRNTPVWSDHVLNLNL